VKVVWLATAAVSLDREFDYLSSINPHAARSVFTRIVAVVSHLGEFPQTGRRGQVAGTRELVVTGLPYMLVYRVTSEQVEILRGIHTATNWPESLQ